MKANYITIGAWRLLLIFQSTPTINSNFSLTKNSFQRETISYICGLRARIGCEPVGEHSTRSDRVTNIGYCLPLEASPLPAANYYLPCTVAARREQIGTVKMTPILEATPCMISIPMSNILIICKYS